MKTTSSSLVPRNPAFLYFGKIASRGDFVRSASSTKLQSLLDNWLSKGMDLLIAAPDWKHRYDERGFIDALFLGTKKKHVVCSAIIPSHDSSGRRFPFTSATLFEVEDGLHFLPLSALATERHVNRQRALVHLAAQATDAADTLSALEDISAELGWDAPKGIDKYLEFLNQTTLGQLQSVLEKETASLSLRHLVLALGYLLRPMLTTYATPPQKGIILPLPLDPARIGLVKTLWLDLISLFLIRADFEISVFSYQQHDAPRMMMTFNGATPQTFSALFAEGSDDRYVIDLSQSAWVEDLVRHDNGLLKLASYLDHPGLPLNRMVETFKQSFVG